MMGWVWYHGMACKHGAAQAYFGGGFNSFVHIVMYFYYLVKAVSKQDVWWKESVTWLQLVQFICVGGHSTYFILTDPAHEKFDGLLCYLQLFTAVFMFFLFSDFFYRTYCRPKGKGKGKGKGKDAGSKPKEE